MSETTSEQFDAQIVAELTRCQSPIELYVRGLMPGDPSFEEVVQQANAKIWESRHAFELGTNFRAWAMSIARFEVFNFRKRQARDARLRFSMELTETMASELEEATEHFEDRQAALRLCLEEMHPNSRALVMSRYGSSESLSEFALRAGRSVGGLRVSLNRIRKALAECIERKLQLGGGTA